MTRSARRVTFDEVLSPVSAASRAPRYAQVIAQVEQAVRRGLLMTGDFLPTESQLCDGFGVARSTLRRAMGDLEERGLISRTQGRGTRVEGSAAIGYRPETSDTIFELIAATHREPRSVVQRFEHIDADADIAALTGFPVGAPLLWLVRDRFANDVPIAGLENYLLAEAAHFAKDELVSDSLDALLRASGWTTERVDYVLHDVTLDARLAGFMRLEAGVPALREHRRAYADGQLFNFSVNTYHPENYL